MAKVKLVPLEGCSALAVGRVLRLLRDEFTQVEDDRDEGREHVAQRMAATLRFAETVPGKQERLAALRASQLDAVYVTFGDDFEVRAGCCVMPDTDLFFGSPDEVDGPARPLVERAARALGYRVREG